MRTLRASRHVRLARLLGEDERPKPAVGQTVVVVACQLADRIERQPGYGIADARRDNAAGWTVRLRRLGPPCRGQEGASVRLTEHGLRRAAGIALRMVAARARTA